ncbi:Ribosomal RNA small subunit methyltransferase E [hydrothermal vent metagenome]|uniref:16S rRNA (uracil(1498)-N(3))-methyltransferase n=1 Tax=hydrothermal vent metagenome TaxID=652676 RepID=A0A1W1BGZ9_9ZZZZ
MIFLFDENTGKESIKIRGENYKYLIKVRRHKEGDILSFRSEDDPSILYHYKLTHLTPREAHFELISSEVKEVKPSHKLHIGWCIIDPKSIEKTLPTLNEIGVDKISFIYCKRSQKNFKIDLKRLKRILKSSMQQCGRSSFMEFAIYNDLQSFLDDYTDVKVFDFCETVLRKETRFENVLIGCEGGFSDEEREILNKQECFKLDTPLVLRSESAACAVAAKILL